MIKDERKIEHFQMRFTTEEREVLRKRAKKARLSDSDHLRACMMLEAVCAGDKDAWKVLARSFSEVISERVEELHKVGIHT